MLDCFDHFFVVLTHLQRVCDVCFKELTFGEQSLSAEALREIERQQIEVAAQCANTGNVNFERIG